MIIKSRPNFNLSLLFKNKKKDINQNLTFTKDGRTSLFIGLNILGYNAGDKILVPAFICSSTLQPLYQKNLEVVFYDIKKDLDVNLIEIEKLNSIHKPKAILSVNFFGFISNLHQLKKFCKKNRIFLIEDCCHCFNDFQLNNFYGKYGDISFFSLRKHLPITDGGILKVHNSPQKKNYKFQRFGPKDIIYLCSRIFEYILTSYFHFNIYSKSFIKIKKLFRLAFLSDSDLIIRESYNKNNMIPYLLSKYLYHNNNEFDLLNIRRNNFIHMYKKIGNLDQNIYKKFILNTKLIPQWYPVKKSVKLIELLQNSGVGAISWPGDELPSEVKINLNKYPNTKFLCSNLILLPIHQSIKIKHINFISKFF